MEYTDYYKALGVERNAGKEDIKKQYRKLARKYHPDVNTIDKNAAAKFREINEANEVLSDDEKRKKYDELGSEWEQHQHAGPGTDFDWVKYASGTSGQAGNAAGDWSDLFGNNAETSDFFRNIFGQGFGGRESRRAAPKGQDFKAELTISLEEAYVGGTKNGTVLKLNSKGFPVYGKPGNHGDLFLRVALQLPEKLTQKETLLFKELAALRNEKIEEAKV